MNIKFSQTLKKVAVVSLLTFSVVGITAGPAMAQPAWRVGPFGQVMQAHDGSLGNALNAISKI